METKRKKPFGSWELMHPDDLVEIIKTCPYAYVPLGTYEHHGHHLPVCFDGIKAHALCLRAAERTGGAVLPTFFYGTGGGHVGYRWTMIYPEEHIRPLIASTLDGLAQNGFKVVLVLTGHYAGEQVQMVHQLAEEAALRNPGTRFIGLTEPEVTTAQPGDPYPGDHAAKYETSIAMALDPQWARLDRLRPGREEADVLIAQTPRGAESMHDPKHPLYAIYGQDPRITASQELGEKLVAEITGRLVNLVVGEG